MQMKIIVEDNGIIGLNKENIGNQFIDYSKLNERRQMKTKGTIFGLTICRNIINKMGG